jgi:hypothetical protein
MSQSRRSRARLVTALSVVALAATVSPASAANGGVLTAQPAMLTPSGPGMTVKPLITVGETIGDEGYRFESIPDGIALRTRGNGRVDVFVNHETSRVPFPYTPAAPTEGNSQNDYTNAMVSQLVFNRQSGKVVTARTVIESSSNYQRFCSSYLATAAEGFDREILFTNEEGIDWVNRSGDAWPATIGAPEARQVGVVVAHDVKSGQTRPIWGMGRHNHENSVPIPGYDDVVLLSGDDTFTNMPSQSQLYSYIAADADAVWNDQGALWAFVSNDAAHQKYEDFEPGSTADVTGHWIQVPRPIATGRKADGTEVTSSDFGYPAPPNTSAWQRDSNGIGIDGPQWVLDYWSQTNHVFNFVRVEDIAYDKRAGQSNVVYVVDSGRGTSGPVADGKSTNGRVWKMVLDPADPTRVDSFSIFLDGDDSPVKTISEVHQPDNIETADNGILLTEDPGSSQQFNYAQPDLSNPNRTAGRVMYVPFGTRVPATVLTVDQSADEGPTDVDAAGRGSQGAWEATGIVDASAAFGPDTFLVNVQAHTLWVAKSPGADNVAPAGPDFTDKREGGQLLLVRIPGA